VTLTLDVRPAEHDPKDHGESERSETHTNDACKVLRRRTLDGNEDKDRNPEQADADAELRAEA
jgi:hypothetical protein